MKRVFILSTLVCSCFLSPTFAAEAVGNESHSENSNTLTISLLGPALRASDLDRSIKYYTTGLGMKVATTLKHGTVTEVILSFGAASAGQPVLLLFRDEAQGKSPAIDHGNGFGRVVLRASNVSALSARLSAAGYAAGEVHEISASHMKILMIEDPDGYRYEITEPPASKI